MTGTATGALFRRVLAWLDHQQWELDVDESSDAGSGRALLSPSDGAAPWPVLVFVHEQDAQVCFYSLYPDEVGQPRRAKVADLLTHVNDGLVIGAAEMSMGYGDLRIRTSVEFGSAELPDAALHELLGRLLGANLELAATTFPAIDDLVAEG